MKIRIGTRKSRLAMIQTELVRDKILERFPDMEIELVPMSTMGDKNLERSLTSFGGKGVFTKELEEALLAGTIDMAVHSAKDMPMEFLKGLAVGAVLERANPGDVLVTRSGISARKLPAGSIIGTSSLRRELQIKRMNPGVQVKQLRGNVLTRLQKLRDGDYDGILLAAAGLERLDMIQPEGLYLEYLDKEAFVPAPGQGILAVQSRVGDLHEVMSAIHSEEAAAILYAEREYLTILGGGCNAPCGAYCRKEDNRLVMTAMYAQDGIHSIYRKDSCDISAAGRADLAAIAKILADKLAMQVRCKKVSLVGAGPGDAGLFTQKGLECIRQADVIIYDNLIPGSILNEAPLDAELFYAGKRSGKHHLPQKEINALLVEQAQLGKYVVRLKGGDPLVFGRGGEELLELKRQGIPFEVVPGISSAYSVPTYAGIPVTDRKLASSFHVITGHEGVHKGETVIDYSILAREEGTLIFLMGLKNLEHIVQELIFHGKDPGTPTAVIQEGTTSKQRKVVSTLESIAVETKRHELQTPAMIVVGDVVSLEEQLDWFGTGPLTGKRVLITGSRWFAGEMEAELKELGAECAAISLIESRPLLTNGLQAALKGIMDYQWLVFTSGNGVEIFFEALKSFSFDLRKLMHLKFAVIGKRTKAALAAHGFYCDFVPRSFTGEDLANEWIPSLEKEERVLMLRAREGAEALPGELEKAGISFTDIPLYETWNDERRGDELNREVQEADYVILASASAVNAFAHMLFAQTKFTAKIISIGPATTKAAEEAGLTVYKSSREHTAAGIAAVILDDTGRGQYQSDEEL